MRGFRVGIVNPFAPFSTRVRELLSERRFPIIELKHMEARSEGGSSFTEFQDEVVITQPLDEELFPHLDVLFVGGDDSEELGEKARSAAGQDVLTIVSNVPDVDSPLILPAKTPTTPRGENRLIVVARPASALLGTVLSAIASKHEIRRACGTVMVPASALGKRGIEELHEQVVKILNFQEPPTTVFPAQLAFNLMLPGGIDREAGKLDDAVSKEAAAIAEIDADVSVMTIQAPVFHGYALSLWIQLEDEIEEGSLIKALEQSGIIDATSSSEPAGASPVSVADSESVHVGSVRADTSSRGAYWLWVVADALAVDTAVHAVRTAERILGVVQGEA
jgi:aspartate-semialdehyde dehydrogenase